jgi:hypothetical protein
VLISRTQAPLAYTRTPTPFAHTDSFRAHRLLSRTQTPFAHTDSFRAHRLLSRTQTPFAHTDASLTRAPLTQGPHTGSSHRVPTQALHTGSSRTQAPFSHRLLTQAPRTGFSRTRAPPRHMGSSHIHRIPDPHLHATTALLTMEKQKNLPVHHLPVTIPDVSTRMSLANLNSNPLHRSKDLLDKVRRARTDNKEIAPFPVLSAISATQLPDHDYVDTDQLRTAVFSVIKKRLQSRNVDVSHLNQAVIAWSLPKSCLQQDIWKLLLNSPLQTPVSLKSASPGHRPARAISKVEFLLDRRVDQFTPEDLMAALLDPTPFQKQLEATVYSFYIRSFRIQVRHRKCILCLYTGISDS